MKNFLLLSFIVFLASCGSKGTSPDSGESRGCGSEAQTSLDKMISVCSLNMEIQENKETCQKSAEAFKTNYAAEGCLIQDGDQEILLDSTQVQTLFLDPLKDEEQDILDSGIFDE